VVEDYTQLPAEEEPVSGDSSIMRRRHAISRYLASALCVALALAFAGCGESAKSGRIGASATPPESALRVRQAWAHNVANFRPLSPMGRHPVISSPSDLRLRRLSRTYGFSLLSFDYLPAKNAAAMTVRTARRPILFADEVSKIEDAVDPAGRGYTAFFFEAQDSHGTPFIATEHSVWGTSNETEIREWARSPNLYISYRAAPPEP
jgi:hypothetical protein